MPRTKIIELPIIKDDNIIFGIINDKIAQNRMNAIFEEFEILKYYLNSKYEDSLKLAENDDERDMITQSHEADLEILNREFGFRISEIETSHEQGNLLNLCLKKYGISQRNTPI